jgi:hypothetical protein
MTGSEEKPFSRGDSRLESAGQAVTIQKDSIEDTDAGEWGGKRLSKRAIG